MTKEDIIETIAKHYAPLSDGCKSELAECVSVSCHEKDTTLVKEGQYSDQTFFIIEGCARAYYLKDGKDVSDWFAFENDFISSIKSFFLSIPSPHFIEVLEDTALLKISRSDTLRLSDKYHDFERLNKAIAVKTVLQQHERLVSMQFHTAEQKYENLLSLHPNITQRVPLTHIASYMGITLETLSRIRSPKNRI